MNDTIQKPRLLKFLQEELNIPSASINLALNDPQISYGSLPMLLWRYGLINLSQLELIFDWLDDPKHSYNL
ncbi:hypothetical protein PCC7424_4857 [Gloeothece citriformis PCC 7424]|uniref:DUF2949 domain-containing protein n=1 Tax=Gloeothece citriformis (strain PCC 7424) TaxID=65393 RepID=B7KE96_GLOC7|nr:DUF2949 domain-containing protein [Gloeothece citriformis]ACK73214.1 hypothetical protein PCC7424_4857 [Gloeothece citriformis PCC 7424]